MNTKPVITPCHIDYTEQGRANPVVSFDDRTTIAHAINNARRDGRAQLYCIFPPRSLHKDVVVVLHALVDHYCQKLAVVAETITAHTPLQVDESSYRIDITSK